MADRPQFKTRSMRLVDANVVRTTIAAIANAPIDPEHPLEVIIREEKRTRNPDQNQAMWAGPLRDISEQAWVGGRRFAAEVWHEFLKREYLPEDDDPEIVFLVNDGYHKWATDPSGNRVMIGSTTQLTVKGMACYLTQIEAYGAGRGVQFHAATGRYEL